MKKIIAIVCLLLAVTCLAVGCKKLNTDSTYTLYTYDMGQQRFVSVGAELWFTGDRKGYGTRYPGGVEIMGEVGETFTGYTLSCRADIYLQALQAKEDILGNVDERLSKETLETLDNTITAETQIFAYGDYLFGSANIDLMRKVDMGDNLRNYTAIEGYYDSMSNSEKSYLFKKGKVYANLLDKDGKAITDKDGNRTYDETPSARYQLQNGMVIFTVIDVSGRDVYVEGVLQRLTYLFATISYPKELADFVYTQDKYSDEIKELAAHLAGKSVGVLTKTFYSTKDPN